MIRKVMAEVDVKLGIRQTLQKIEETGLLMQFCTECCITLGVFSNSFNRLSQYALSADIPIETHHHMITDVHSRSHLLRANTLVNKLITSSASDGDESPPIVSPLRRNRYLTLGVSLIETLLRVCVTSSTEQGRPSRSSYQRPTQARSTGTSAGALLGPKISAYINI